MPELKKWILVIEDDEDLLQAISIYLDSYDFRVLSVSNVRDAIRKLKMQEFCCVITDINLGMESGEDIISYLKSKRTDAMNLNIPVIVISGILDKDLVEKMAKNINGAFVKPFEMKSLLKKINELIGR